ncbi:ATP-dependent RNA helicase DDX25 isoform X2 [Pogoniulus pusillus]|uniref:ATP-dependent RNA helicase DDX25 isoform X2 n=1 Tax=Pogoniulus pusillus TaxID=488313 RepID=UPI0030B991B4
MAGNGAGAEPVRSEQSPARPSRGLGPLPGRVPGSSPSPPQLRRPGLPPPRRDRFVCHRATLAEASLLNKLIHTSLVESSHSVEILQQDPRSPLFSIKTFEELTLKKELLEGIYAMGFNRPSKIQGTALPIMLAYPPQNLIAQSQSGTGKTAAFALAMLSRVNATEKHPQCLCLAPTYELALQIGQVIEKIGLFCTDIRVTYAIRGNRVRQGRVSKEQIVVGTPGTVLDWCFKLKVVDLSQIRLFVLDEADIMIDTQNLSQQSIRVQRALPKTCQLLLFSATFRERVRAFARQIVANPIVIKLREEELTLTNIRQYFMVCHSREHKYRALCNIYGSITIGQAMIFCQVEPLSLPREILTRLLGTHEESCCCLCPDPQERRVAGSRDVPGRAPGGHPDRGPDGGAESQHHPALPRRAGEGPHRHQHLRQRHRRAAGDCGGELQPAHGREEGAGAGDLPAPHRAHRALRQAGHRLQHAGAGGALGHPGDREALPHQDQAAGPRRHGGAGGAGILSEELGCVSRVPVLLQNGRNSSQRSRPVLFWLVTFSCLLLL